MFKTKNFKGSIGYCQLSVFNLIT